MKEEETTYMQLTSRETYAAGETPAPVRADLKNRYGVLVHGMPMPGDHGVLMQRRRTRKATSQPRKNKTVVLRGGNLFEDLEQAEVLAAMCALLLSDPREVVTLHIERPSTYAMWARIMHGGEFKTREPVVGEVLRRSRVFLRGVWVTTDVGGRSGWDTKEVENSIVERWYSDTVAVNSLLRYADECWAEHVQRGVWLDQCRCGKINYSAHEILAVMLRAKSGQWHGDTRPAKGFYRCPTGSCFHTTSKVEPQKKALRA